MAKSAMDKRVIVIGSGMAGISAANFLAVNGVANVIVLEAATRIGGRLKVQI